MLVTVRIGLLTMVLLKEKPPSLENHLQKKTSLPFDISYGVDEKSGS